MCFTAQNGDENYAVFSRRGRYGGVCGDVVGTVSGGGCAKILKEKKLQGYWWEVIFFHGKNLKEIRKKFQKFQ